MSLADVQIMLIFVLHKPESRHKNMYSTKYLLRVGNPRLYEHSYQSQQLPLWEVGEVEWHVIIRCDPPGCRRRKGRVFVIQSPLFADGTQG